MNGSFLFAFERDFAGAFQCIPMAVRYKLDLSGVKLSLRQWKKFAETDRRDLLARACETPAEALRYRAALAALIGALDSEAPVYLPIDPAPQWQDCDTVPAQITGFAGALGVPAPALAQWRALEPLQRFALLKLSRQNHDNVNFIPAMQEFGLAPP